LINAVHVDAGKHLLDDAIDDHIAGLELAPT